MTHPISGPLLGFRVVADRAGKPCALLVDSAGEPDEDLLALAASDTFRSLTGFLPCLYPTTLDPALAATLAAAGWAVLPESALQRVDGKLEGAPLPPGTLYVDGNWCTMPPATAQGAQAASRLLALQLVQLVAADAHTHEIEALLRRDATLSYHLLRLVNSLGIASARKVTSFSQAILILGRQQLRRWLNLMLFAARQGDIRSAILLSRVSQRAQQLELLARARGMDKNFQERAFMTGMFSLLGILFGMPLPEVLDKLPIHDAVRAALVAGEGELGAMLRQVEAAERGDLATVAASLPALGLDAASYNRSCLEASVWMLAALRESQAKP